ncbi:uncharacterized protein LOC135391397 [Ornithodoros turicata]|uniref:uncharacterized protein LOC135391397 n=1 Tax=Ornithodoros turicata TaxID=34597 RepID=UPI0031394FDD
MVRRSKRMRECETKRPLSAAVVAEPQVDIGNGVLVGSHHLTYLKSRYAGQATKFARALLRALFTPEELKGKSLFGMRCNAYKDKEVKDALDRSRVTALIAYTMVTFNLQDDCKLKNTLSSLLVRECK